MTLVDKSLDFLNLPFNDWIQHMSELSEAERKRLLPLLKQQRAQDLATRREDEEKRWDRNLRSLIDQTSRSITACLTAPREIATHISRSEWAHFDIQILLSRDVDFLPQVYEYLLKDLISPDSVSSSWLAVERTRVYLGLPRPNTPRYAVGLESALNGFGDDSVLEAINASPDVIELIPTMLSSPEFYFQLHMNVPAKWTSAIAAVLADGRLDRTTTIEVILEGLLTHNGTAHLQALSQILDVVKLTREEIVFYQQDLIGILDCPRAGSATQALALLLSVADELTDEDLINLASSVLLRPQKGNAMKVLRQLERRATASPAPDDLLLAAATAFGHPKREVAEYAVGVVAGLVDRVAQATREQVSTEAELLEPILRPLAAGFAGGSTETEEAENLPLEFTPLPDYPPRITTVDELFALVDEKGTHAVDWERLGDGVLRFRDDPALAARVADLHENSLLAQFITGVISQDLSAFTAERWPSLSRELQAIAMAEVFTTPDATDFFLSYPDRGSGQVDPDRVLADLARAAGQGRCFVDADLTQTLLRLPTPLTAGFSEQLAAIDSDSARALKEKIAHFRLPRVEFKALSTGYESAHPVYTCEWEWLSEQGKVGEVLHQEYASRTYYSMNPHFIPSVIEWTAAHSQFTDSDMLPHLSGTPGIATFLQLGALAGTAEQECTIKAIDLLLEFAAQPGWMDTAACGRAWGEHLMAHTDIKITRWVGVLNQAYMAGAPADFLWPLLRGIVQAFITTIADPNREPGTDELDTARLRKRPGLADLVDLAADLAPAGSTPITGLESLTGKTKLARAAARLHQAQ
ncbi:hypothetical protein [Corynebacterium sp. A21]|uniref:hypothetical protein n=1 Tax=Corynebacterium sp. A21 TaxID=3457318 RepID=UPI003FCFD076